MKPRANMPLDGLGRQQPLPARAEIVVVGGGVVGLAIAYNLAVATKGPIVVLEKSYLCSGASGRNGGGVRVQWSSPLHIEVMKKSMALCRSFASHMGINVWFRQGGYLFVARDTVAAQKLDQAARVQRDHGLMTRLIQPDQAKKLVPELRTEDLKAASYNPRDGVVFPWPFVWGYAKQCAQRGVEVHTFTPVTDFRRTNGRITEVVTHRGTIETSLVINAAGAWSVDVAKTAGVELPNRPKKHEICSTEPLKPFLGPLVAELASGLYVSQSMRGELVGGMGDEAVDEGFDQQSSLRFLVRYGRALSYRLPALSQVKVLRQWAGCYDTTPDGNPLLGWVDPGRSMFAVCGFVGYGFMMAPAVGELVARYLAQGLSHPALESWALERFDAGVSSGETMLLG